MNTSLRKQKKQPSHVTPSRGGTFFSRKSRETIAAKDSANKSLATYTSTPKLPSYKLCTDIPNDSVCVEVLLLADVLLE